MAEFKFRNINDAFRGLVNVFASGGSHPHHSSGDVEVVRETSRNGAVLRIAEPVTVTYERPLERVLFNSARDASPFLHLMEALYHLAGRNDVAPLAYYAKQFERYSDDGVYLNGAYGYRWRHACALQDPFFDYSKGDYGPNEKPARNDGIDMPLKGIDQLDLIVAHLKAQPDSRRAVLAMWDVESDLLKVGGPVRCDFGNCLGRGWQYTTEEEARRRGDAYKGEDGNWRLTCHRCGGKGTVEGAGSRDVACNTQVMFALRQETGAPQAYARKQDAHSAGEITYGRGKYQVKHLDYSDAYEVRPVTTSLDMTVTNRSNDLVWGLTGANYVTFSILQEYMAARLGAGVGRYHHFTNNLHVYDDPGNPDVMPWKPAEWLAAEEMTEHVGDTYPSNSKPLPLVHDPATFDNEVKAFVEQFSGKKQVEDLADYWNEPFLAEVAQPMMVAFACHKVKDYAGALTCCAGIEDDAWRIACEEWMRRRMARHEAKGVEA